MVHSFDILTSYLKHLSPLQGYFLVKTWVVIPYSNRLEKLTLLREGFVQICREFTEILTEMCSFRQNMGLLPLIPIVSKS